MKIGYDTDSDADITDAGDDIQVPDDFNSNVMTLSYDHNGNLSSDGVYQYVYDGWNRLRKAQRVADGDTTTIGTYAYWPDNRRASKTVEHCGSEAVANDGGDTVVCFYYSNKWQILETRNGSSQATRQWVWGARYVDEILFLDVNGDPATSNICDADDPNKAGGTRRYFPLTQHRPRCGLDHDAIPELRPECCVKGQDRNWNVVALSEYGGDGVGTNGRLAERYAYTPYGEFVVLKGDGGSGELGRVLPASGVGNIFFHQGLPFDQEKGSYQNRKREYRPHGFAQRDSSDSGRRVRALAEYRDGSSLYAYLRTTPTRGQDPTGGQTSQPACCRRYMATYGATSNAFVVCCCGQPTTCYTDNYDNMPYLGWRTCVTEHEDAHKPDCRCGGEESSFCKFDTGNRYCSECHAHAVEVDCLFRERDNECGPAGTDVQCEKDYACRIYQVSHDERMYCTVAGVPPEHDYIPRPGWCE